MKTTEILWFLLALVLAVTVFCLSYLAIAFFWCLKFWPRWLPWPSKKSE